MSINRIILYYDVVCPYAYLASTRIEALAALAGVPLEWKPILLGGVFRAIGAPDHAVMPAAKARLNQLDLQRWAAVWGVFLRMHPEHPRRTVEAMRLCHAVEGAERARLTHVLYRQYFVESRDPADRETLAAAAAEIGRPELVDRLDDPTLKDALRRATEEAVADGVFGVPAFVVEGDDGARQLYWGQDRIQLFLPGAEVPPPAPDETAGGAREVTFFYDFSSPYAYLGSTQIERVAREHRAEVRWRPFLLGALFKEIGTPLVPLESFNAPKRRYYEKDMRDWATHWGVALRWPSRFPLRTVTALRLALAVDEAQRPALSRALFRAAWVEDRDLADAAVLTAVAAEAGVPADAVERAQHDPALKQALVDATAEAVRAGVCGAPSFLVGDELFWGQDRLDFVARALARQ